MIHVYSTLSCSQRYVKYAPAVEGNLPREERAILINGGANIAGKHFLTPKGVHTSITEQDYELLKENELFKTHISNGFITVEKSEANIEKVVSNMESRSQDAPVTPQDYEVDGEHVAEGATVKTKKRK